MKKLTNFILLFALAEALASCAVAPVKQVQAKTPREISVGTNAKLIAFKKMGVKIPLGDVIAKIQFGWMCAPGSNFGWRGGKLNVTDEEFAETFRKELEDKNYPVIGESFSFFGDTADAKAEILVAGVIEKVEINSCFPYSGSPYAEIGNTSTVKGGAYMRITWQIYSQKEGKVVSQITTEGTFQTTETISGGMPILLRNAYASNVQNLLADAKFYDLVRTSPHISNSSGGI